MFFFFSLFPLPTHEAVQIYRSWGIFPSLFWKLVYRCYRVCWFVLCEGGKEIQHFCIRKALLSQSWGFRNASLWHFCHTAAWHGQILHMQYYYSSSAPLVHVWPTLSGEIFRTKNKVMKPNREAKKSQLQPTGRRSDVGWCTLSRLIIIWDWGGRQNRKGGQVVSDAAGSG